MNECRFARGGIYPVGYPEGPSHVHAECLLDGEDSAVEVVVRFLQLVERQALDAWGRQVEELVVGGERYLSSEGAVEREVRIPVLPGRTASIGTARTERQDLLEDGVPLGCLVQRSDVLHGTVEAWFDRVESGLRRIHVNVANRLAWDGGSRMESLMHTLCSTQVAIRSPEGVLVSQADLMAPSLR